MVDLPNPLDKDIYPGPIRILSDRGIKQAIDQRLIRITPELDYEKDTERIQPATLDVKIKRIEGAEPIDNKGEFIFAPKDGEKLTMPAYLTSTIDLTELIDFGQLDPRRTSKPIYLNVMTEARSSLRRLGCYMANRGVFFFSGPEYTQLEISNFSNNDLHFQQGERVAQVFFRVDPFADYFFTQLNNLGEGRYLESGEQIRGLNMGVEVRDKEQLRLLHKKEFIKISPKLKTENGLIKVHAGNAAFRMRRIQGGIDFSRRKGYLSEELLEPIDISKGYTIKPFEHILIETKEQLELSPHVGIRFWDNLPDQLIEGAVNSQNFDEVRVLN